MSLPKLWGNRDNRKGDHGFVYSHIQTVFYNYKDGKMLNEKLGEMDTSIEGKIDSNKKSDVQVNDTERFPSSALTYTMDEEIKANKKMTDLYKAGFQYSQENIIATHENNPRGKVLTDSKSLQEIIADVAKGDFSDIYVGDIIKATVPAITQTNSVLGEKQFVIIGINRLKNHGDTPKLASRNHLVLIPLDGLGDAKMNGTNVTTGGYKSSDMNTTIIPAVVKALESAFGAEHVLQTREYITTTVNNDVASAAGMGWKGSATAGEWSDQKAILMTEVECYGCTVWSSGGYDNVGYTHQFPGMALDWVMNRRFTRWLRSVSSSTNFCVVHASGIPAYYDASNSLRVVPRFVIG